MNLPLVSCDPGVNYVGLALWRRASLGSPRFELCTAQLVDAEDLPELYDRVRHFAVSPFDGRYFDVAVEVPQIYTAGKSKGSGNDLVDVALVAGAVLATGASATHFRPREWKGNAPKDVVTARSRAALSGEEAARVMLPRAVSLQHNVWDAIGIGLYALRRRGLREL